MDSSLATRSRSIPMQLVSSSVGKKYLVAVTGFISFGYVVGHMAGNLQIFIGQDRLNDYAEMLHSLGGLLWVIRLFLLAAFVVHVWLTILLKLENWASRPVRYAKADTVRATLSSRTMIYSGLTVLAFVVYHLLQFTVRVTNPAFENLFDEAGRSDVYSMVILGFQNPYVSTFYIVAVGLLCYHLSHGIASMFQSMGWNNEKTDPILQKIAAGISIVLFLGYISIPTAVLTGFLQLPSGGN